jgi:farnesyl-diphosphate farnesyltransferase
MPTLNELLHAASRTFAVGIDLLPEPLRGEVEIAYLLLRVSDYLEDNESMEPDHKAVLLERWAALLEGSGDLARFVEAMGPADEETPDALVARNAGQVLEGYRAMRPKARAIVGRHVRDSSRGMARWARRGPDLADEADLDDYMHEVAGRVGWLLTELFALDVPAVAARSAEMMALGREFGLGLQTVNVIRGLHADRQRGWVYVPRALAGGGQAEDVFGDGERELSVLSALVEKAERHLAAAERYILLIPRRRHGVRLFCLLPYLFAVRTLALSRATTEVFHGEVKIARPEVVRIARASRMLGWSNAWIRWYARRLATADRPRLSPR